MESNQVHLVATAVPRDSEQIIHALESRFSRQLVRNVADGDRGNRIHDDVIFVHLVTTTDLDVGALPNANAASDPPPPDSLTKAFGEFHFTLQPIAETASPDRPALRSMRRRLSTHFLVDPCVFTGVVNHQR